MNQKNGIKAVHGFDDFETKKHIWLLLVHFLFLYWQKKGNVVAQIDFYPSFNFF